MTLSDLQITEDELMLLSESLRQFPNAKALGMLGIITAGYLATTTNLKARNEVMELFIGTLRETVAEMELQEKQ